jgi:HD-like signal output (HDOD) protein
MNKSCVIPSEAELKQAFQVIRGEQIPSVPDILVNLYTELEKAEPDTALISDLVSKDQAITGQVIKSVNAPLFGLGQRVESIQQAVVLLGLGQIRNLVTAAAFKKSMHAKSPAAIQIWNDSLQEAHVAMNIAYHIHNISQDEAYLAALLHNCGALLLAEKFSYYEQLLELENEYPVALINKENQHLGTNHAVVGYLFAEHWKLPKRICQAIYLHHSLKCDDIEPSELRALIATLKLANLLVREKYLAEGEFALERIQYLSYAKKELMFDNHFLDELRTSVIPELENSTPSISP